MLLLYSYSEKDFEISLKLNVSESENISVDLKLRHEFNQLLPPEIKLLFLETGKNFLQIFKIVCKLVFRPSYFLLFLRALHMNSWNHW